MLLWFNKSQAPPISAIFLLVYCKDGSVFCKQAQGSVPVPPWGGVTVRWAQTPSTGPTGAASSVRHFCAV